MYEGKAIEDGESEDRPRADGIASPACHSAEAGNELPATSDHDDEPLGGRWSDVKHKPGSLGELLDIAVPLVISAGSFTIMNVIDRVFLSWYSTEALAASLPGAMYHWVMMALPFGLCLYCNSFVAQYDGAGKRERVSAAVWQGVYLAVCAGLILIVAQPVLSLGLQFMVSEHTPEVASLELDYFQMLNYGSPIFMTTATLSTFFSGRGRSQVVMTVNIISMAINAVVDYLLIFGLAGFPEMGIKGAGLATVLARSIAMVLFAWLIIRPKESKYHFLASRGFDRELFGRLLRFGLPAGWQLLADVGGFAVFLFVIGRLGMIELAASTLAFNINSIAFIPLLGVGMAVSTIVGRRIGEQRPELAITSTWKAFWLSSIWVTTLAAFYLSMPAMFIEHYRGDHSAAEFDEMQEMVIILLRFVAIYTLFDAMAVVFSNAVRGAGDTRFSLWFTFASCWLIMVIPTYVAVEFFEAGLQACWYACTIYIVVVGVGFFLRFQHGGWKSMRVIESDH